MSTSKRNKEIASTKAYYEKYADVWAKTHADAFHDEVEFRFLKARISPTATVVDIGCAAGVLVPLFLGIGKGLRYQGFDIAKKFVALASKRYPHLSFTQGDIADRSTLPKKKFDAFIARSVLMHLPFTLWDTACANIEHLTKRGAYGYVVLPSSRPPALALPDDTRHFTLLSEKDQIEFFKKRGWTIIKKFTHATGPNKANWIGYIVQLPLQ